MDASHLDRQAVEQLFGVGDAGPVDHGQRKVLPNPVATEEFITRIVSLKTHRQAGRAEAWTLQLQPRRGGRPLLLLSTRYAGSRPS